MNPRGPLERFGLLQNGRHLISAKRFQGEKLRQLSNPSWWKAFAKFGGVAQLIERLLCKQDVAGLIPVTSTKLLLIIMYAPGRQIPESCALIDMRG